MWPPCSVKIGSPPASASARAIRSPVGMASVIQCEPPRRLNNASQRVAPLGLIEVAPCAPDALGGSGLPPPHQLLRLAHGMKGLLNAAALPPEASIRMMPPLRPTLAARGRTAASATGSALFACAIPMTAR